MAPLLMIAIIYVGRYEGNTEIKKQGNTQKVIEILIHVAVLIAIYGATV